ncbi:hypothetical protein ScPMuIL_002399 [Solemya velum]
MKQRNALRIFGIAVELELLRWRMSEDKRRGEGAEEGGPGLVYMPFVIMEELLDKLRLLGYEKEFSRKMNLRPISRHYFAIATNPGEQFFMFTSLAAWLLRIAGCPFEQPQEYDDPNATISSILQEVRKYGHTVDFPPSKLKQGCGEHCIYVLDRLANEALKSTDFQWGRSVKIHLHFHTPEEEMDEDNVIEDDSDLVLNKEEDDNPFGGHNISDDFEEEEPMLDLEGLQKLNQAKQTDESSKPEEILESTTDAADWKLEVERVLPQLKVTIRTDNKDWRVHMEQMHQHKDGIEQSFSNIYWWSSELYKTKGAETKERYRQASVGVTERSRLLAEVTDELEKVKQEMEERGSSMTDGVTPMVKIKQSIQQLKKENMQMDIRNGVVEHILLQAKLKDKNSLNKQAHSVAHPENADYRVY